MKEHTILGLLLISAAAFCGMITWVNKRTIPRSAQVVGGMTAMAFVWTETGILLQSVYSAIGFQIHRGIGIIGIALLFITAVYFAGREQQWENP